MSETKQKQLCQVDCYALMNPCESSVLIVFVVDCLFKIICLKALMQCITHHYEYVPFYHFLVKFTEGRECSKEKNRNV